MVADTKDADPPPEFRMSLHGFPYEHTVAAVPPVPHPPAAPLGIDAQDEVAESNTEIPDPAKGTVAHSDAKLLNESLSLQQAFIQHSLSTVSKQLHPSIPVGADGTMGTPMPASGVPNVQVVDDQDEMISEPGAESRWALPKIVKTRPPEENDTQVTAAATQFEGLTLSLPGSGLGEELRADNMKFSNRGSMLIDGQKMNDTRNPSAPTFMNRPARFQRIPTSSSMPERLPPRIMSIDEESLSEKVRKYYMIGTDGPLPDEGTQTLIAKKMGRRWQDGISSETESARTASRATSSSELAESLSSSNKHRPDSPIVREQMELAGGLEDWQNIQNTQVDRYGFIAPRSSQPTKITEEGSNKRHSFQGGGGIQRVSTSLHLASETPRRKHTLRRNQGSPRGESRSLSRSASRRSNSPSQTVSARSGSLHRHSTLRAASNRLPGNRDRRVVEEAADMLTLPRSLTSASLPGSDGTGLKMSRSEGQVSRRKEAEREEKWRKMARPITNSKEGRTKTEVGGGMLFEFPPLTDSKLVSRTWKGIPDSWRSAAWHYFLTVSARRNPSSVPDEGLIESFYAYQDQNSPDDVQIDIDVPRTISSHIMFRRRYRGGQRLLFRVLHAMSLYFAETGYVQGMAALAATLLAYYEEEKAFVMLVRLWETRGLGRLYQNGFGGLMEALDDFEKGWLGQGEVAKKLTDLNVFPTAYGTKWYLTLFNYSIPFPAQLRVWDVFMLLGDDEVTAKHKPSLEKEDHPPLGKTLDVLHATSAALIDGMRDILLESDFENAMKVLTSWIPIRDEDLFMRVAKAEWKLHHKPK